MAIKKCPACNSSKVEEFMRDGEIIISCSKCGFINKRIVTKK